MIDCVKLVNRIGGRLSRVKKDAHRLPVAWIRAGEYTCQLPQLVRLALAILQRCQRYREQVRETEHDTEAIAAVVECIKDCGPAESVGSVLVVGRFDRESGTSKLQRSQGPLAAEPMEGERGTIAARVDRKINFSPLEGSVQQVDRIPGVSTSFRGRRSTGVILIP